ncbi:S1C family serine protease [Pseudomonas siliginis]|uniref:S1C family serine protease n=1 Tax=Pseudomonas siliginis TaxID=2842346 RepID=UPI002092788A|nr:S1C family serine protease [Pseudomonas siliginis]UST72283.1 S1C family serine protease [Pseudomonas siliginis]
MTIVRTSVLGFALSALVGCNGILHPAGINESFPGFFTVSSGAPVPYMFQGSAVQWNREYAVSAAHIPLLSNVVHHCSTGCDLVFIRHKAEDLLPTWRPTVAGEKLQTVGLSPFLVTVKGAGTSKGPRVSLNRAGDSTAYALSDAPVVQGMSGGPVYGDDGAVVGMTIGIFLPDSPLLPPLKNSASLSVYVPYDIIQREWRLFSERQAAAMGEKPTGNTPIVKL